MNSTEHSDIRKFGGIALIFFGLLCGVGIWTGKTVPIYLFGALSVIGLGFMAIPRTLKPVYVTWLKVAYLIGRIITVILLTFAYYFVLVPLAILRRIIAGKPLPMKPDKAVATYWVTRDEKVQPRERFLKRY